MTVTKVVKDERGTLTMQATVRPDGRDQEVARAFFDEVDRRARIEDAVADYETRGAEGRPYEDAVSIDELAHDFG